MTPEKKEKIKSWISEHKEDLFASTVVVAVAGGFVTLVVFAIKDENNQIKAQNDWITNTNNWLNEEEEKGNAVYQLSDLTYLTVPKDSPAKRVIK